jgi:hypothetical protein
MPRHVTHRLSRVKNRPGVQGRRASNIEPAARVAADIAWANSGRYCLGQFWPISPGPILVVAQKKAPTRFARAGARYRGVAPHSTDKSECGSVPCEQKQRTLLERITRSTRFKSGAVRDAPSSVCTLAWDPEFATVCSRFSLACGQL